MASRFIQIDDLSFDSLREAGRLKSEAVYQVHAPVSGGVVIQYAITHDGTGVYWYDTLEEAEGN